MRTPDNQVILGNIGIMENQMEKNLENEMETGIYRGYIGVI